MERIIQPYAPPGPVTRPHSSAAMSPAMLQSAPSAIPPKTASDFLRALRKRAPVLVMTTVIVAASGAAYVVKMPDKFRAVGHLQIEPPRFDTHIIIILANGAIPNSDRASSETYVPNRLAQLQGRRLANQVLAPGNLGPGPGFEGDPAGEVVGKIAARKLMAGTGQYEVSLEGDHPDRVTKVLDALLRTFEDNIEAESGKDLETAQASARTNVNALKSQILALDKTIETEIKGSEIFAPGNKHLPTEEYTNLRSNLLNKKLSFENLRYEERMASMWPELKGVAPPSKYAKRIEYLLDRKEYYEKQLEEGVRLVRNTGTDPSTKRMAKLLNETLDDLEELQKLDIPRVMPNRSALVMAHAEEEIRKLEREVKSQLDHVQETMPTFQRYLNLNKERDALALQLSGVQDRLNQFEMAFKTRSHPVEILQKPSQPGGPVSPNRPLLIAGLAVLGFFLGAGLVCGFEFLDRSVKVPEHLAAGLGMPILSVIPRMKRLARFQRGGHLWTAADSLSIEADSYRNLRASLIGASGTRAIVTLLVTSAKAGEGKSTTALNLALTCARAGERTLLMDVDLRRPSLAEVFDATEPNVGLVDVLRGDMPWQQAVVRTDVPNLNFLPTGDPTGVPIEVLGTLELRQLIAAVSKGYQRVILDAPAVLGLADCRMLGRTVDAAVLVVRSGVHELRPLRRAKDMLEQSRVPLAGVVFNGLSDDLDNWSCYGPNVLSARVASPTRTSLEAPSEEADSVEIEAVAGSRS